MNDAPQILNEAFGSEEEIDIDIGLDDNLQDIANKINSAKTGLNAYILRVGNNEFDLIIKSDNLEKQFAIYSLIFPNIEIQNSTEASLIVDGNHIRAKSNEFELLVKEISIHLLNDSPIGEKIKLSVRLDTEAVHNAVGAFTHAYNDFLDFFKQQTEGNWKDTAVLHDNKALQLIKGKITNFVTKKKYDTTSTDFGILFDNNSSMYIDSKKLNQAFNQEENHKAFHQIINDFAKVIEELIGYKGPINTEIDQIIQNGKKT